MCTFNPFRNTDKYYSTKAGTEYFPSPLIDVQVVKDQFTFCWYLSS